MKVDEVQSIRQHIALFKEHKQAILDQWLEYEEPRSIIELHDIQKSSFKAYYGSGVFDYFMNVITGDKALGDCPVMHELLTFLKDKDISANELFIVCSHFRKSMLDFSYDAQINSKALFDEISFVFDGNFSGVLKLYTDTIYQKEQEIAKNVELLNEYKRALDESAIVSKTDANGIITYANANFCAICGYTQEELIGQSHNVIRHPDTPASFFQQMWQTLEQHEMFQGTIQNRNKAGESYYLDITILPITDPFKGVKEFIAIGYEVTTLINTRQEALEAAKARESFLSSMSHEIRTPLNAILGFVTILLDEEQDSRHRHYLNIINNSGENLLGIINDILDFSKLRSGVFKVEKKEFNPHDEFSHVLELFSQNAYGKEILMRSYIDPNMPSALISDPLRIKQIFSNLLSNAIKFTPDKGEVEAVVECDDVNLKIMICDNGEGIAVSEKEKIFNAFEQAKESRGGTGLGLSISRELSQHMGGTLTYVPHEPKGSCFTCTLPVERPKASLEIVSDWTPFQKLNIAVLCEDVVLKERYYYIRRYWECFGLKTFCIQSLDEVEYDLLFFIDAYVNDAQREKICSLDVPSIALMQAPNKRYDDQRHVASLVYPVYGEKMYRAFLEALEMSPVDDAKYVKDSKQRRFKGHILVAEDNVANQELIKIILERYGLSYYIASDGVEAVQTFKVADFDLVFMDEQMPRKDGLVATKEILAFEQKKHKNHTPVIGLSANVIEGAKERALSFGCDAFLGKPIVIKDFESVLERYLIEQESVKKKESSGSTGIGSVDIKRLKEELFLEDDEIVLLLETFVTKMKRTFPTLSKAVEKKDYSKIGLEAHSIKGSAANFRFEELEKIASLMEQKAKAQDKDFSFKDALVKMEGLMAEVMS